MKGGKIKRDFETFLDRQHAEWPGSANESSLRNVK